jgi:hypothetical protein
MLGLDSGLVCRRLHRHEVAGAGQRREQAEEPVVVRRARPGQPGLALPRTPPEESMAQNPARVDVSPEEMTRKLAETAAVSALLATIFTDDGPAGGAPPAPASPDSARLDSGRLDVTHSRLLGELATRSSWSRAAFAELAARHGVMPSGALDLINEAAMEAAGELAIKEGDELIVNDDTLRELLA